jgi:hypothetical protein
MIGGQNHLSLVLCIPNDHSSEDMGVVFLGIQPVEMDQLITQDVPSDGDDLLLNDRVVGVLLHASDEINTVLRPIGEQLVIVVAPVHGDNRTWRKGDFSSNADIMLLPVGNIGIGGKVAFMIQKEVEFDCPLGASKLSPGEKRQAEGDDRAIRGKELIFEAELPLVQRVYIDQGLRNQVTEYLPRSMGVGVRESRFVRGIPHSKMLQFSHGRGQPPSNLSEALGLSELAEQHGHKVIPRAQYLAISFGTMLSNRMIELTLVEQGNQWTKKARTTYHDHVLLVSLGFCCSWHNNDFP